MTALGAERATRPDEGAEAGLHALMQAIGAKAKAAAAVLAVVASEAKDQALRQGAANIRARAGDILAANAKDVAVAEAKGLGAALIDRLVLDAARIEAMARGLDEIAAMPDPIGAVMASWQRPNGLHISRVRTPLGVIGVIYESRPNVTADAAGLCLKAGNAVILRGGSEAIETNRALAELVRQSLSSAKLSADAVQLVDTTDRAAVSALARLTDCVDLLVPRGGRALIERLMHEARVPMLKHLDGICHVYIDEAADIAMAIAIADNAKTQRFGTCNTMETLLVAQAVAPQVLPPLARMFRSKGVELRCCPESRAIVEAAGVAAVDATEADWRTEYLAPILAISIVPGLSEAIAHINRHGSRHTDAIVTGNHSAAMRFMREVDSASVLVNASTRLADGFEYGLGAEIGISNDKLHARGPVGLEGLTSLKYVVFGNGELRGSDNATSQ